MIYKSFAAITLIAAPIVVLVVQSLVPQTIHPGGTAPTTVPATSFTPPAIPAPVAPSSGVDLPVSAPSNDAGAFGQPMPDAAKPFLAPGTGLPATAAPQPAPAPVELPTPSSSEIPQ